MTITKLKNKLLLFNSDLSFNKRLGLPIEVFCPQKQEPIAFGRIERYNEDAVFINGKKYDREKFIFFGCQKSA
ncbi:hypothetical protein [Bacillus taeanensis]|uniref:Uncharacterized protein n=1 Tax=Bacillus taeanensis TaxID=273032 RepID=A0A366XWP0_9BACI|nr:hypothetical protein [Bacillus taeanensis]RBW70317.1 hypothetical protein DS031_07035 [Bacillus taeanensis]